MKTLILTAHGNDEYTTTCFFCGNTMYIEEVSAIEDIDKSEKYDYQTILIYLSNCRCPTCSAFIGLVSYYGKITIQAPQLKEFDPPV